MRSGAGVGLRLGLRQNMSPRIHHHDTCYPSLDGMPADVLIVEDDPIIALDFEDTCSDLA